jgi:L-arabinose isomerase
LVSVPASATTAGTQTLTATVVDTSGTQFTDPANAEFKIDAGVSVATSVVNWGAASIDVVAAKGAAKFSTLNLKGKTVTVTDGKKKYTFKPSSAKASNTIKLAKGSHKLVIKGGAVSKSVTIVVP